MVNTLAISTPGSPQKKGADASRLPLISAATADRKPNSVPFDSRRLSPALAQGDDHSSSPVIADGIKRPTRKPRTGRPMGPVAGTRAPLFGLAPCGVLPATPVARRAVRSYRTFSPLLVCGRQTPAAPVSGVFSVPLSFELPRPGVTRRTTLWSSDFPLFRKGDSHPFEGDSHLFLVFAGKR